MCHSQSSSTAMDATKHKRCHPDLVMECEICFPKCFMSHPKAECWNIDLNDLTPLEVPLYSKQKYHFICDVCKHPFETTCHAIASKGRWCSICTNQKRCPPETIMDCEICFANCFMSHPRAEEWNIDLNELTPMEVSLNSHTEYHFICGVCKHPFQMSCHAIVQKGRWCGICSNQKRCPPETIMDCEICFANCFMSHPRAEEWDIDKNELTPMEVSLNSHTECHFICGVCKHPFEKTCKEVSRGNWCGVCSNQRRCPPETIMDCDICFANCFMSHPKAEYWDIERNDVTPMEVALHSKQKCHFICDVCSHPFEITCKEVLQGNWCGFCGNRRLCPPETILDCESCFAKCFMSYPKAEFWDNDRNDTTPMEVFRCTNQKFWFNCETCGSIFRMICADVSDGHWCSKCKKKTQKLVYDWCVELYGESNVHWEETFTWCESASSDRLLPFDISVESSKCILEIDGIHHFETMVKWKSNPDTVRGQDVYKMNLALEQGYRIIRLYQKDVWQDPVFWRAKLLEALKVDIPVQYLSHDKVLYERHVESLRMLQLKI